LALRGVASGSQIPASLHRLLADIPGCSPNYTQAKYNKAKDRAESFSKTDGTAAPDLLFVLSTPRLKVSLWNFLKTEFSTENMAFLNAEYTYRMAFDSWTTYGDGNGRRNRLELPMRSFVCGSRRAKWLH
jgi:hypothetical protein